MAWFIKFARYNEIFASTLGIILNLLLAYLVCTVKSKIGNISRILLQNCFVDTFLAVATLFIGAHSAVIDRTYYVIVGSSLNVYGFQCASYLVAFFAATIITSMQALPVPFYVRYQMLCKNKEVTIKQFLILYGLVFSVFIIMFMATIICYPPIERLYEPFKAGTMTQFWLDEFPGGPVFTARKTTDIQLIAFVGIACIVAIISYCLVLYYSIKITRYVRFHANAIKQTKIQNKQLHQTLIAQAIGPLISVNTPVFILVFMIFFGIENNYVSVGISSMLGYVGFVNPLAALIIISPYRRRIAQILKLRQSSSVTSENNVVLQGNPIIPIPVS